MTHRALQSPQLPDDDLLERDSEDVEFVDLDELLADVAVASSPGTPANGNEPPQIADDESDEDLVALGSVPPTLQSPLSGASLAAIAGYRDPPSRFWQTPSYVAHVLERHRELRTALRGVRRTGPLADVLHLEACLAAYDRSAVLSGVTLIVGAVALPIAAAVVILFG